jgi:hypothetical protein
MTDPENTSPIIEQEDNDSSLSSGKRSSEVYQYFRFKSPRWYCNYCQKNFADKSTTTLWCHVNKNHPKIVETQKERKQEIVGDMDKFVASKKKESVS